MASESNVFINALREFLGLCPLPFTEPGNEEPHWSSMPFEDGNFRTPRRLSSDAHVDAVTHGQMR